MGENAAKYVEAKRAQDAEHEKDHGKRGGEKHLSHAEQKALKRIKIEAKAAGATLWSDGEGGLPPSTALGVFRKGKWRCSISDCKTPKKDLDLDHPSGHVEEMKDAEKHGDKIAPSIKKAAKMGHVPKIAALRILCRRHHVDGADSVHGRENAIEAGKTPAPMKP